VSRAGGLGLHRGVFAHNMRLTACGVEGGQGQDKAEIEVEVEGGARRAAAAVGAVEVCVEALNGLMSSVTWTACRAQERGMVWS